MQLAYDEGESWARAATATLYVDGAQVGAGRVEATVRSAFSADETTDLGSDSGRRSPTTCTQGRRR